MIQAAIADLTMALHNLCQITTPSKAPSLPIDTLISSSTQPLKDLISMYNPPSESDSFTTQQPLDLSVVPIVETLSAAEFIISERTQGVETPVGPELIASPVVVIQGVEILFAPEQTHSVKRVATSQENKECPREELAPPVTVVKSPLAPPPGLKKQTTQQYYIPQTPAELRYPVPYVIPAKRDRRLRQEPRKKANNAVQLAEASVIKEAIEQAKAEREFQQTLDEDIQYRLGYSNMAVSNAAMNLTAEGKPLTRAGVMSSLQKDKWIQSDTDEYVRLTDSNTWHAIYMHELPAGRKSTYLSPQYKEKIDHKGEHEYRSRFTAGGDRLDYPGAISARTADMEVVKVLLNSTLSTDSELMTMDIKDFYLGTPLEISQYIKVDCKFITPECMDKYDLHKFVHNGYILHKVDKSIYGLKEAGRLSQDKLISHLEPAGYIQCPNVPCLFIHKERDTKFSLIVDDFLVMYRKAEDAKHLIDTLKKIYIIKVDEQAKKYIGLTIERDRPFPSACRDILPNFSSVSNIATSRSQSLQVYIRHQTMTLVPNTLTWIRHPLFYQRL
jgi:hypothetical protein